MVEWRGAVRARTAALNQLDAVLVTAPDELRRQLAGVSKRKLTGTAARLGLDSAPAADVMRRIARRVERLSEEITDIDHDYECVLVGDFGPHLIDECGVGAVCAALLVVSSGDPGRMASEASFAALAGTTPVGASSGKQQRHRLNRGGDRQLNWALHVIALQRIHHHPQTAAYQRPLATGKTAREARPASSARSPATSTADSARYQHSP